MPWSSMGIAIFLIVVVWLTVYWLLRGRGGDELTRVEQRYFEPAVAKAQAELQEIEDHLPASLK